MSDFSTILLAIMAEGAGDVSGHCNYILDGARGGRRAHPSWILTLQKMRVRERERGSIQRLVSASSVPLTPGTAQSPYLVEDESVRKRRSDGEHDRNG